jgi:regulator of protease activity HflC (stomatin/prohibitin superfamily)
MLQRIRQVIEDALRRLGERMGELRAAGVANPGGTRRLGRRMLLLAGVVVGAWLLYRNPPFASVAPGELGIRENRFTGSLNEFHDGQVLVLPAVHSMRVYSLRDQIYRPGEIRRADGPAPLQSVEGLSLGVDLTVRYALDPTRLKDTFRNAPENPALQIVEPDVQGIIYKTFSRYTVREIFSTRRTEIQQNVETELRAKLAQDGILLRGIQLGKVDLPPDYRRGMEALLAEELASEKMRYTLELKDKQVKETELEAEAQKVRREKLAEAAAREQIIAAKGQEEAMKHVLPFKQRQIEQRQLEAEADKAARIKGAEANAQARRIEATGEADARTKLADAESYRMDQLGKVNAEQMAREGALLTKHPLLIQKTLADKLSDKVQVIIAPTSASNAFIASGLLGTPAAGGEGTVRTAARAEGEEK